MLQFARIGRRYFKLHSRTLWRRGERREEREAEMSSAQQATIGVENHFARLPDEIAVHIFDRLSGAKSLCRCSAVSKRFASLIRRVHTVSVAATTWKSNSSTEKLVPKPDKSRCKILCLVFPVLKFLAKLKQIQSLHLEFPSRPNLDDSMLLKWGAKLGTKIETITFLHPKSLREAAKSEGKEEESKGVEEKMGMLHIASLCVRDMRLREGILKQVVYEHPMFQSVAMADPNKRATKLCLSGEKLVEFRSSIRPKREPRLRGFNMAGGHMPAVLQLPGSGAVMEGLMLYVIRMVYDKDGCDIEDDYYYGDMLVAFGEGEGTFRKAVVEIMAAWITKGEDDALGEAVAEMLTIIRER